MKNALVLLLAMAALPAAAMPVHFDCFLPGARADCRELTSALLSSVSFLSSAEKEEAELVIALRSVRVDGGVRYTALFVGSAQESPRFDLNDRIPDAVPGDAVLVRLIGLLQRGLAPFLSVAESAQTEDGALPLRLRDPSAVDRAVARDDVTSTGWFIRPSASFNWNVDSTERLNLFAGGRANYSSPWWRTSVDIFTGYNSVDDKDLDSEIFVSTFLGTYAIVVHTLDRGFSIMGSVLMAHDSNDNQFLTTRPAFGVEWIRQPFLESDTSNYGVRYQLGGEHVVLLQKNERGRLVEDFLLHDASAFASWHQGPIDVELRASFRSILDDLRFSSLSGNGSITWRITDAINLSLNGNASFRNQLINAPAEESDDPLQQIFGGNFGAVSTGVNVNLAWTWGNALLDRQDRRWRS